MDNNGCKTKPDIEYPCSWQFKVIGSQRDELEKIIAEVVGNRECLVALSRSSSGGKFVSINLEMVVEHEEDRNTIYTRLSSNVSVKMVL